MNLITVLVAVFLERFVGSLDDFRKAEWFRRYVHWLAERGGGFAEGPLGVFLALAGPLAGVWLAVGLVDDVLLGLLEIVLGVAVLIYCFGPKDLEAEVDAFVEAHAMGDAERRRRAAVGLAGEPLPEQPLEQARAVARGLFSEAHSRTFAVLFWFIVLGPLGAALYRLARWLGEPDMGPESMRTAALRWVAILDWAPARLTALSYALTGRFEEGLVILRRHLFPGWEGLAESNRSLLREVGAESINLDEALGEELDATELSLLADSAMNLLTRSLVVWIVALALLTIGGWAG